MENKRLIGMTDFVLNFGKEDNRDGYEHAYDKISSYARFLKQPLTLGMFVPCDEDGNVLEEPLPIHFGTDFDYKAELSVYKDSLGKCLFEGFELSTLGKTAFVVNFNKEDFWIDKGEVIEDLLSFDGFDFELTTTAIKQLGL